MKWTLLSLHTTSGYLQSCPVEFASGLNCIIGARGTCKSTVVETIRFVFDCEPEKIQPMVSSGPGATSNLPFARVGLLLETLAGGTAKCAIGIADDPTQSKYVVERNAPVPSRVYRDGVQQIDDSAVLHRIEIYSQAYLISAPLPFPPGDRRVAVEPDVP